MGHKAIRLRPTSMLRKQSGQMRKLLGLWGNGRKKKTLIPDVNSEPQMKDGKPNFLNRVSGLNQTFVTRRQLMLNRHFTEIISDVLALSLRKQLSDTGITITSIETKAWNKGVCVYYSTPKPFDMSIHKNLYSLISQLKFSISERRLIGRVPPIHFVYDQVIDMERKLSSALDKISLAELPEHKGLVEATPRTIDRVKSHSNQDLHLRPREFSAPDDMTNDILGLNYPLLYNRIVAKLERGRGESSRMIPKTSLASTESVFTEPLREEAIEDEDPAVRILKMRKFLVEQRKKLNAVSKKKRMQELLNRDKYKWDETYGRNSEDELPDQEVA